MIHFGHIDDGTAVVTIQSFPQTEKIQRIEYEEPRQMRLPPPSFMMLQAGIIGIINWCEPAHHQRSSIHEQSTVPDYWTFNTYTNRLSMNYLPVPNMVDWEKRKSCAGLYVHPYHFWRDQIIIPAYLEEHEDFEELNSFGNGSKRKTMVVESCTNIYQVTNLLCYLPFVHHLHAPSS